MRAHVRTAFIGAITMLALIASPCAGAQSEASPPGAVSVEKLVAAVAKRTGKKFLIDPRVRADVIVIGQDATSVDYATLLLILRIHGFSAVEQGGYVQVIPDANIRQFAVPLATGKESYPDAEYVNRLIVVKMRRPRSSCRSCGRSCSKRPIWSHSPARTRCTWSTRTPTSSASNRSCVRSMSGSRTRRRRVMQRSSQAEA